MGVWRKRREASGCERAFSIVSEIHGVGSSVVELSTAGLVFHRMVLSSILNLPSKICSLFLLGNMTDTPMTHTHDTTHGTTHA